MVFSTKVTRNIVNAVALSFCTVTNYYKNEIAQIITQIIYRSVIIGPQNIFSSKRKKLENFYIPLSTRTPRLLCINEKVNSNPYQVKCARIRRMFKINSLKNVESFIINVNDSGTSDSNASQILCYFKCTISKLHSKYKNVFSQSTFAHNLLVLLFISLFTYIYVVNEYYYIDVIFLF